VVVVDYLTGCAAVRSIYRLTVLVFMVRGVQLPTVLYLIAVVYSSREAAIWRQSSTGEIVTAAAFPLLSLFL
jgi:hypothetical protein